MNIIDYLKDKVLFLLVNFIIYFIVAMTMIIMDISKIYIVLIFLIWFGPLTIYLCIEGIRKKMFYDKIINVMEGLDREYLVSEVIKEPYSADGKAIYNVIKRAGRSMAENVKEYELRERDYREYIETWVHEIKTPIASSKLIVANNRNTVTDKINYQISRIEGCVEQVLYYGKSNNVNKDYIIKNLNLRSVIINTVKRNSKDLISKSINIYMDDIDKIVYSDGKWIEFIVNQIILNSIRYCKDKDSYIKFYAEQYKNSIVLVIEDNGIGIDEIDIPKVFEKGFTGQNGRAYGSATGIGMYLCKKLCDKLGIKIYLESQVQQWTKVSIVFPINSQYDEVNS